MTGTRITWAGKTYHYDIQKVCGTFESIKKHFIKRRIDMGLFGFGKKDDKPFRVMHYEGIDSIGKIFLALF